MADWFEINYRGSPGVVTLHRGQDGRVAPYVQVENLGLNLDSIKDGHPFKQYLLAELAKRGVEV